MTVEPAGFREVNWWEKGENRGVVRVVGKLVKEMGGRTSIETVVESVPEALVALRVTL